MPSDRTCANPLCGSKFRPARVDAVYCGSTCRAEATRLRELFNSPNGVGKAVRSALHKREQPKQKVGARRNTIYAVMAVLERAGAAMTIAPVAMIGAHSRDAAVRAAASESEVAAGVDALLPVTPRSFKLYGPDGRPLSDG